MRGQEISCYVQHPYPRTNTVQYLHVHFDADEIWEPLKKIAVFRRSGTATVAVPLDETMMCEMPPQMMAVPGYSGPVTVHIGLIGVGENGGRLTTGEVPVTVNPSCYTVGKTPHPPAPDVYEELLRLIREAAENDAEEIRAALDAYFAENPIDVSGKLDKNQGAENAGKVLGIGEGGVVVPVDAPTGGGESGIYIGSGDMPEGYNVQIDPNGDAFTADDLIPDDIVTSVNGQTGDVQTRLVVTFSDDDDGDMFTMKPSHTSQEIYAAYISGQRVEAVDSAGASVYRLSYSREDMAIFEKQVVSGNRVSKVTFTVNGAAAVMESVIYTPPATSNMVGATASVAGTAGLVPAPAAGDGGKFLRGDGTWGEIAIPEGGGGGETWEKINEIELTEDGIAEVKMETDEAGNPFTLKKAYICVWAKGSNDSGYTIHAKCSANPSYPDVYQSIGLQSNALKTAGLWSCAYIEHIADVAWHTLFKANSAGGASSGSVVNYDTHMRHTYQAWQAKPDGDMRGLSLTPFSGTFSAGTKFIVYGVRA